MYKVILVDDEKWIVRSLKDAIDWHELGFEIVAEAFNGIEGYEKIKELCPDLVFTDIRMPGMDGLEMVRKSNELQYETSFIITTGYKEFEYAQKAIEYGALNYCLKPFDELEIARILRQYVKKREEWDAALKRALLQASQIDYAEASQKSLPTTTFEKIIAYIDEHFRAEVSLQNIADELNLNLSYVSQLFRKEGDETYRQYLTKKRMAYACELIKNTQISIQEISELSGYLDYSHFAKIFRKSTGMTATQYRELFGKK